jgi:radical SAM protein with 4Fe4S-binding SPASM domain
MSASRVVGADADFVWVDPYFAHIRRHFEVRAEDELLIVMPNQAYKLNRTGLRVLRYLKDGGSIADVLGRLGEDAQRRAELFHFLCDFRSLMKGCLRDVAGRKAVRFQTHPQTFNALPVLSEIALTYRCNLRCRFCYAGCNCRGPGEPAPRQPEMTTDEVVRVLGIIRRDAQVPSLSFTGGEPTLREDLAELVRRAVQTDLRVNLITNGVCMADGDLATRLKAAGLASAQVSLEGPDADIHDELTGVRGSFERTLAGLAALRDAGVHVHTNTTINALNATHLSALVRLAARLGLERISMNLVIPAGTASDRVLQVSYRQVGALILAARQAARQAGIEFLWYSPTPLCLFNPIAEGLGNKSCAACDGLLSVSPGGEVLPCSSYPESVGHLLRQPFREVWDSARAAFFRRKAYAPRECEGCADFGPCAGACPLYWDAMGTTELKRESVSVEGAYAPA